MSEPRRPSLRWIACEREAGGVGGHQEAGQARGASSPDRSGRRSARPSRSCPARSTASAPLMRQPPSVFSARVFRLAASEPVSGSVSPKQPSASPEQSRGSHSCFCSSVPQRTIDEHTSEVLHRHDRARRRSRPRPTSSTISAVGAVVDAAAAVLLGHDRAEEAHVGQLLHEVGVEVLVAVVVRARGTISLSAKSRAVSRISRCSSVSSKSIKALPAVVATSRRIVADRVWGGTPRLLR